MLNNYLSALIGQSTFYREQCILGEPAPDLAAAHGR